MDGRLHRKYFAVDGSAGVPSGISWNLGGASTLEPGTDRRRHREKQAAWYARLSAWLQRRSGVQIFFGSLLFLLLAWLPVYLAYYPGICAYDAPVQTGQIMEHYYFDHHPIVHTLFLQGMLWLGSHIFGSVNAGMAFYTVVQMLLLSGSMAYGMLVLHHRKTAAGWQLAIQLLGMFFPFHWYMSVSMTKDTVFSAFLLLQLVSLADLLWEDRNAWRPGIRDLLFALGTVGMILFRNNGKYAMIVLLAFTFLTFCFGKKRGSSGGDCWWYAEQLSA